MILIEIHLFGRDGEGVIGGREVTKRIHFSVGIYQHLSLILADLFLRKHWSIY